VITYANGTLFCLKLNLLTTGCSSKITSKSPFKVVYECNPKSPLDRISLPTNQHYNVDADERARAIKDLHE
jgi:hypothetical protein